MPLFTQRLAQRDYDLILVSPMKRRMLLKMYCMGEFFDNPLAELEIYLWKKTRQVPILSLSQLATTQNKFLGISDLFLAADTENK